MKHTLSIAVVGCAITLAPPCAFAGSGVDTSGSTAKLETFTLPGPYPAEMEDPANWIQTPGGRVHPSCHHQIPSGATVDFEGNVFDKDHTRIGALPQCQYPVIPRGPRHDPARLRASGDAPESCTGPACWVEDDWLFASDIDGQSNFNGIEGTTVVPLAPQDTDDQQLIYMFNSLQTNADGGVIFQPVLQWGSTCAGNFWCDFFGVGNGGNFFQVANWTVGNSYGSTEQTPTKVDSGDEIFMLVAMDSATQYYIGWSDETLGKEDVLTANLTGALAGATFTNAEPAVLEMYNVARCQDLPQVSTDAAAITFFFNVSIFQSGPAWDSWNQVGTNPASWLTDVATVPNLSPACGYFMANASNSGGGFALLGAEQF